jgi:hypothetical protein
MFFRKVSLFLAGVMLTSLVAGCTGGGAAPNDNYSGGMTRNTAPAPRPQQGMSTKKKLVLLAGAAALAYLYNKHKNNKGAGPQGQYYRSKNGRIYYRDAKGQAHWVTPPSGGIQVPADEADQYRRMAPQFDYTGSRGNGGY